MKAQKIILVIVCCVNVVFARAQNLYDFIVAQDGSGNFKTVQEAINAVPDMRKKETVIFIKNGTYKEKLLLPESKSMVTFIGENVNQTILAYDDYAGKKNVFGEEKGTSGSAGFYIYASNFTAENICFQNTAGSCWTSSGSAGFRR